MKDYAVISKHEKGFWQIDVYWKMEESPSEGDVPDHFKTCKTGEPVDAATRWAKDWYPNAEVLIAEDEDTDEEEDDTPAPAVQICPSCKLPYKNGDTCPATRGGCPMGGDF